MELSALLASSSVLHFLKNEMCCTTRMGKAKIEARGIGSSRLLRNPALPPQYKKKSAYMRNHIEVTLALFYCVYSSSSSSSAFLASFLTYTAAFLCSSVSLALRLKLLSGVNSFFSLGDGSSRIFSWTLS